MTFGIDVADGEDVSTTPIKDLLFTSRTLSIKNVLYIPGRITPTSYTNPNNGDVYYQAKAVIPHNLGYEPVIFVYFRPGNINGSRGLGSVAPWINDTNDPTTWSFLDNFICTALPDDDNITLQFRHGQSGIDFEYRVFILVEASK